MLVDFDPVGVHRCSLARRERKRIPFVDRDRFWHLVVPPADVRTDEVENALQWGYEHLCDVIGRVDAQLPREISLYGSSVKATGRTGSPGILLA